METVSTDCLLCTMLFGTFTSVLSVYCLSGSLIIVNYCVINNIQRSASPLDGLFTMHYTRTRAFALCVYAISL